MKTKRAWTASRTTRWSFETAKTLVVLGLAVACCAGRGAPNEDGAEVEAIRVARERCNEAIRKHELDEIVTWLELDARLTTSSGQFFEGRAAQREAYAVQFARFPDVVYVRTPTQVEISRQGPFASERGNWIGRWTAESGSAEMRGRYTAMWRQAGGHWRIRAEIYVALECVGRGCPAGVRSETR